jgi:tetratricopeptide (TPR) repeat protein
LAPPSGLFHFLSLAGNFRHDHDTLIFWFDTGHGKTMARALYSCKNRTAAARIEKRKNAAQPFPMAILVKLIASTALGAISMGALLSAQQKRSDAGASDLQKHYDLAQHFQQTGNLASAAPEYRAFLAEAEGEVAAGHAHIGDYARAASLFEESLALEPDSLPIRLRYAQTALLMNDASRAESLARSLLSDSGPDSQGLAEVHRILGRALHKMNRDREAREEMEKAIKFDPSFQNGYDLAVVCLDLDDGKCASQVFAELEHSFGDTPAIHMQFGLAYGNSDFGPLAIAEFRKVIAENPRFPGAHYSLAASLLSGRDDGKDISEAEIELNKELTISPHDFLTYAALGKLAVTDQNYTEAERYLKRATSLNPANPDAYLYLGQMYFDTHRLADAETALRKAIRLTRDPSRNRYQIQKAHFLLGRVLMMEHRSEDAHAEMEIAHTFVDQNLSHDQGALAGLLNNNSAASALTDPPSASSNSRLLSVQASQDKDPRAVSDLSAFEKRLSPAIADSYNNLGAIAATGKDYSQSLHFFQQAAAWNPTIEGLDLNWGRAAFMASRFADAIPPLSRYVRSHPDDSGTRGALAMSQFMTHDFSGCVSTFRGVEDQLASIPQMEYVFAESLVETGQVAAGKKRMESLSAAHPEIADVHRALGEVYESEGERKKANGELSTAIELNATDPQAHYDLGKVDVETGDAAAAIVELETATRLTPGDPAFHRELAAAYRLASRNQDAEKELAISLKLTSEPVLPRSSGSPDPVPNPHP